MCTCRLSHGHLCSLHEREREEMRDANERLQAAFAAWLDRPASA